jgi:hypothetical protein
LDNRPIRITIIILDAEPFDATTTTTTTTMFKVPVGRF